MHVYDVEVLDVTLGDEAIAAMLVSAQQDAVRQALAAQAEQRRLEQVRNAEEVRQHIAEIQSTTRQKEMGLRMREVEQTRDVELAEIGSATRAARARPCRRRGASPGSWPFLAGDFSVGSGAAGQRGPRCLVPYRRGGWS